MQPPAANRATTSSLAGSLLVLRSNSFRKYLLAAIATTTGLWLFETGLFWSALVSTGSAASVGLVLGALVVPFLVILVPAGVLADRWGPKRLLLTSQIAWVLILSAGALIAQLGLLSLAVVIALALAEGIFDAVWAIPAQMMYARVVDRRVMANSIILSGLQVAIGRLFGGLLAGALLALAGPPTTFVVGAVSIAIGAGLVISLREELPGDEDRRHAPGRLGIAEAIGFLRLTRSAVFLIGLGACTALFAFGYPSILPVISRDVIHAGPGGLGLMTAGGGVGVLITVAFADMLGRRIGRGATLGVSLVVAAASIAALATTSSLLLAITAAAVLAAALNLYFSTNNLLLQAMAPPRLRGRVLSLYGFVFWTILPFGSFAVGYLADRVGVRNVLFLMAGLTLSSVGALTIANRSLVGLDVNEVGAIAVRRIPFQRRELPPVPEPPRALDSPGHST